MVQGDQGLQLVGCFRTSWPARIFLSLWFGVVILLSLAFLFLGTSSPAHGPHNRLLAPLAPAAMLVFGWLFLRASQFAWDADEHFLAEFVASRVGRIADVTPRSAPARASAQ